MAYSIVSDFMMKTIRVRPQPNLNRLRAMIQTVNCTYQSVEDGDCRRVVTLSGSSSEFFIEPMLSCINDIDIMCHRTDMLAIPAGHPVPRYLPVEFHREVTVHELEETGFPCYVLARRVCKLVKSTDGDYYVRVSTEPGYAHTERGQYAHGPATVLDAGSPASRLFDINERLSTDFVVSIRCLVWPPQATEWAIRRRDYNWPDAATINRVINNGCDIVQVSHPRCREDELMSRRQWRLSFSRAETILLNTWSEIQQLVYHMLRVFVSTVQSCYGVFVIKRYHIKTILLWAYELNPQLWNACVIISSSRLLQKLAKLLILREFPMYFVPECNLLDGIQCGNASEFECFVSMLNNVTVEYLSYWFCNNYIFRCASQYPHTASSFDSISSLTDLHRIIAAVSNERQRDLYEISFEDFKTVRVSYSNL